MALSKECEAYIEAARALLSYPDTVREAKKIRTFMAELYERLTDEEKEIIRHA